ncbi:MAG TPA: hypothetical protein VHC63_01195 [Acidimicrobiales bacterium]|nr:hypothetical protein [Acidimicrobiales bacterium]
MIVVDDLALLEVLAGVAEPAMQQAFESGEVFTTGCWYYRLANALLNNRLEGALTAAFRALGEPEQVQVQEHLDALPPSVGLLDYRKLIPIMTTLETDRQLNMLAADAIATAIAVGGDIVVRTDAPLVRAAAAQFGIAYEVVESR